MRKLLIFIAFTFNLSLIAQNELSAQISLIKELMPDATRVGLLYQPNSSIEASINEAIRQTGIRIIKAPVASLREVSKSARSLNQYDVNFVLMVENKVVTSKNAIKFVVKQTLGKGIPVFTTADTAMEGGAFGQLFQDLGQWRMNLNGKIADRFSSIQVPSNDKFIVKE